MVCERGERMGGRALGGVIFHDGMTVGAKDGGASAVEGAGGTRAIG